MNSQKFYDLYFSDRAKKEQIKIFIASILLAISFHLNLLNLPIKEKREEFIKEKAPPIPIFLNIPIQKASNRVVKEKLPLPLKKEEVSSVIDEMESIILGYDKEGDRNDSIDFQFTDLNLSSSYIPPPPEESEEIHILDQSLIPPERLTEIKPNYPEPALKLGIEGYVILKIVIDKEGNVSDCKVLKGAPFGLTEEAIREALRQKFKPALSKKTGLPVNCYYILTIKFILHK